MDFVRPLNKLTRHSAGMAIRPDLEHIIRKSRRTIEDLREKAQNGRTHWAWSFRNVQQKDDYRFKKKIVTIHL